MEERSNSDAYHPREAKNIVLFLFVLFIVTEIFVNYDAGAIPSVLATIKEDFQLSELLLGVLGALPYLGLIAISPAIGVLLQTVSPKLVVALSLALNIVAVALLASAFNFYYFCTARFLLGAAQSGFCIYCPVWVDEFSSEKHLTLWMGIVQASTVVGVMLGYVVTGLMPVWRWSIALQAFALVVPLLVIVFTPAIYINLYTPPKIPSADAPTARIQSGETKDQVPSPDAVVIETVFDPSDLSPSKGTSGEKNVPAAGHRRVSKRHLADFHKERNIKVGAESQDQLPLVFSPTRKRTRSLLAPSPAGAVLETLEITAAYDDPFVLRPIPTSATLTTIAEETEELTKTPSLWQQFRWLFRSPIYIWTVVTLCALFFELTGIQYWATSWFILEKKVSEGRVRLAFAITAASGPTAGVFWGSFFVDWLGGYKTAQGLYRTLLFCLLSGLVATATGVVAGFLDNFVVIILLIWLTFFFGGAILPPTTGILIAAVDPVVRPFASSFAMFAYNIFGYGLGTFLPGVFMQYWGLNNGMRVIFMWAFIGVIGGAMSLFYARRKSLGGLTLGSSSGLSSPQLHKPGLAVTSRSSTL